MTESLNEIDAEHEVLTIYRSEDPSSPGGNFSEYAKDISESIEQDTAAVTAVISTAVTILLGPDAGLENVEYWGDEFKGINQLGSLVAAVSGTVQSVKIHTPGGVVAAGDTLMTIVPDGAGIEIDAQVDNSDIGFVHVGQPVQIKLDAFPFTRYGLITGKVMTLGRDSVENDQNERSALANPSETDAPPQSSLTYPAKISLDRTWLMVDGVKKALKPGMHVAAEIKTGDRRVLNYLLSPIMQATKEAGRER